MTPIKKSSIIHYELLNPEETDRLNNIHHYLILPLMQTDIIDIDTLKRYGKPEGRPDPNIRFHVMVAREGEKDVGAYYYLTLGQEKIGYGLYGAVSPDYERRGIITGLQHAIYEKLQKDFGKDVPLYAEIMHTPNVFFQDKILHTLGFKKLKFDYVVQDADREWIPVVRTTRTSVPKTHLLTLAATYERMAGNAPATYLTPLQKALEGIEGEGVGLHPLAARHIIPEGSKCPDRW